MVKTESASIRVASDVVWGMIANRVEWPYVSVRRSPGALIRGTRTTFKFINYPFGLAVETIALSGNWRKDEIVKGPPGVRGTVELAVESTGKNSCRLVASYDVDVRRVPAFIRQKFIDPICDHQFRDKLQEIAKYIEDQQDPAAVAG